MFVLNLFFIGAALIFTYESIREHEPRAPRIGMAGIGFHLLLGVMILAYPSLRIPIALYFGFILSFFLILIIPFKPDERSLNGAAGYLAGQGFRFEPMDERDIMFARNRSLRYGSKQYNQYYQMHPEKKAYDDERRTVGGPLGKIGTIDRSYRPNVSMLVSGFGIPNMLAKQAIGGNEVNIGSSYAKKYNVPIDIDPAKATKIVKQLAKHLGADLVGICKTNSMWAYTNRGEIHFGEWDEWGKKIQNTLPFAVVIATEMDHSMIATAPHTPSTVESSYNYAKGAYITTILTKWFETMGYNATAEHTRHYDFLMVPLAIDAGLGELGRLGYLITDKYGPRVRLFAVQTDMPLIPCAPVDIGVEKFCERCLKCAISCPSQAIPEGRREIDRGIERWKLDEEACFKWWGKIGTDCCICMAVCPFSRPNRSIHKVVRYMLRHSYLASIMLPYIDNIIYGKHWKSKIAQEWIAYPSKKKATT